MSSGSYREAVDQAVVHRVRVASGKVRPPAALEEERVACHEATVHEEALASRSVARSVQETDLDLADLEDIVALVGHEAVTAHARRALDPRDLVSVDVDRDLDLFEELGDAQDVPAEQVTADVIRVVVGGQHADEAHPVGLEDVDHLVRRVGGIDGDGLSTCTVPDQVHEVHHLAGQGIVDRDVAARQQLAEVKAVAGHALIGSGDQSASLARRRSFEKISTIGSWRPMRRWSRSMASSWSQRTSVTATPPSPARAVRPDRCR